MSPKNQNAQTCLGFIGLGAIGLPIAVNLLKAGFRLKVHTRSRITETNKKLKGAIPCSSPKEAAQEERSPELPHRCHIGVGLERSIGADVISDCGLRTRGAKGGRSS